MNLKLLSPNAKIPQKANKSAAGYDLFSLSNYILHPHQRILIQTGIAIEIPNGYYGRIAPRSGLAMKHGIDVMAGVIDCDYRGELGVLLHNTDPEKVFYIESGDKIAQIIFEKYYDFNITITENISKTERGDGGFGSTGR